MNFRKSHIALLLLAAFLLAACSDRARIIPRSKLAQIYAEMFIADQWVLAHPSVMKQADTTLFYEPIFLKYGYTSKDYNASVEHYIVDPESYSKILAKTADILGKQLDGVRSMEEVEEAAKRANAIFRGYEHVDFSDSVSWKPMLNWCVADTTALRDSTVVPDTLRMFDIETVKDTIMITNTN